MNKIIEFSARLSRVPEMVETIDQVEEPDSVKSDEQLLQYVFGADPVTGLPIGDLAVYLGDNSNPEIKAYIESNLLKPNGQDPGTGIHDTEIVNKFRSLSDDDLVKFARNHDETKEEYATRLRYYLEKEKADRHREAVRKGNEKLMKKLLNDEKLS